MKQSDAAERRGSGRGEYVGQGCVLPVWPDGAPGTEHWRHHEQEKVSSAGAGFRVARNVTEPTLTAFLPDPQVATGTAVVVCPGGAFRCLMMDYEGTDVARWLAARGVAAFVLKYRLEPTPEEDNEFERQMQELLKDNPSRYDRLLAVASWIAPFAVADAKQAVKLVRERAAAWGIAQHRVGMMGFSAGGRVTADVLLEHDAAGRPDFGAIVYGTPWDSVIMPPSAPPLFMVLASDDPLAVEPCVQLCTAWQRAARPVELHMYACGAHGFGLRKLGLPVDHWPDVLADWLGASGLLSEHGF